MSNAVIIEPAAMSAITAPGGSAAGFDPAVVANDLLGVIWKSPVAATASLQIDMGADVAIDTIMLIALDGSLASATLTVQMATAAQGSTFGPSWSDSARTLLAGTVAPRSGKRKCYWTAPAGAPAAARYIRLNFAGLGGSVALCVGRVVVGQRIALARNFSFGAVRGVRSLGAANYSVTGVPLVRRGAKLRTLGLTFGAVYADEVAASIQPLLERVGTDTPIAIVTDPDDHAQRENRIYFGMLEGAPGTVQARAGSYQADFAMVALD